MAVEESPPFARDRDVALGALAARRPRYRANCGEARGTPFGAISRQTLRPATPRKAANERRGLYHAVITPASLACLANPLPHKAWMPLPPPVTTPFRAVSAGRHRG